MGRKRGPSYRRGRFTRRPRRRVRRAAPTLRRPRRSLRRLRSPLQTSLHLQAAPRPLARVASQLREATTSHTPRRVEGPRSGGHGEERKGEGKAKGGLPTEAQGMQLHLSKHSETGYKASCAPPRDPFLPASFQLRLRLTPVAGRADNKVGEVLREGAPTQANSEQYAALPGLV